MGDLWAQFTALHLIEQRVLTVLAEHKLTSLTELADEIHRRSEAAMRAAIREVPNGVYKHSAVCDGFENSIELKMAMTVNDEDIAIDFAGSAAQVPRSINVCLAYTIAYTSYGVKAVLSPNIPNNEGVLRPVNITAPAGSILNSTPPAAGGARALMGHFLPMMVITALAQALPKKVIANVGSPLWCINLSGVRRDANNQSKPFTNLFFMNGGFGAAHDRDGANVLSWPSNISSTPVEMIEQLSPLRVKHRRLRTGSGGRGQFRGGTGQEIAFENRGEAPITVAFLAERTRAETAPAGIAGGEAGTPGVVLINGERANPKVQHVVDAGATIELKTPGGGGYGIAAQRDQKLIEADHVDGYVSP